MSRFPPLVSVVIPCYQQGHFLTTAIESVLSQSYANCEIIVVNDGSTDNTAAVVNRFATAIRYVAQPNRGLPAARNTGIRESQGDYLLFLDSDDLLHPDAISWLVEAVDGRTDCLTVMGHLCFQGSRPAIEELPAKWTPPLTTLLPEFIHRNPGPPHSYFVPRELIARVGLFNESGRVFGCEDWDLWLRSALAGANLVVVHKIGAYYRQASGSMSTNAARMLVSRTEVLLHAHQVIVKDAHLFQCWGADLLQAEVRLRRRCLAQGAGSAGLALTRHIAELRQLGLRCRVSVRKSVLNALLGELLTERLAMRYFRHFDRARYLHYKRGFF